jgi:hypothetical protein
VVEVSWLERSFARSGLLKLFCPSESASPQCGLILANKEARSVYLKDWAPIYPCITRMFARSSRDFRGYASTEGSPLPMMYFNPKIDTLYISRNVGWDYTRDLIPKLMELEYFTNLRFLAGDFMALRKYGSVTEEDLAPVLSFKKLESFSVVGGELSFPIFCRPFPIYKGEITLSQKPSTQEAEHVLGHFKAAMGSKFKQQNVKLQCQHIRRGGELMAL